jgi:phenylacetate-CoA ligase
MLDRTPPARDHDGFARVAALLPRWSEIPLYRARQPRLDSIPNADCPRCAFEDLPFVTKRDMRERFPDNFLLPDQALDHLLDRNLVELEYTSGTSEERVQVLLGRDWWSTQERAALRLNRTVAQILEAFPEARRATLTTPTCNGLVCDSAARQRSERTHGTTLYVNRARIPFLQPEAELARMAAEIAEWAPQFLDLDPVHGAWFARYCERQGLRFPSLQFIVASYEFVSVVHRRILERVFRVPVFNLYGSTETGHLLMEDERGRMQPSREHAYLETVDRDAGGVGDLVVTTLTNDYMPLLRYRIGDLVQPTAEGHIVHGRRRDALRGAHNRRVTTWDVDACFAGLDGILHYQVRQDAGGRCSVKFLPDGPGPGAQSLQTLTIRLQELLGCGVPPAVTAVDLLPPTPSGKFRLTLGVETDSPQRAPVQ